MGFTKDDWEGLQLNLDRIRFGHRVQRPRPIQLSFLPQAEAPKKPPTKSNLHDVPGCEKY